MTSRAAIAGLVVGGAIISGLLSSPGTETYAETVSEPATVLEARGARGPRRCFRSSVNLSGATRGDDFLLGRTGRDVVRGLRGDDNIFGLSGSDRLCGGRGDDTLNGGEGFDRLNGGRGYDICREGEVVRKCEQFSP